MKRHQVIGMVIALAAALAGVALSASPAAANFPFRFRSDLDLLCLQPVGGSIEQGAAIVQVECTNDPIQHWTGIPVGTGIYHFQNDVSRLCLDARGGASTGTPVQQWTCNSISNENWEMYDEFGADSPLIFISRVSGTRSHCLDVPWAHTTIGLAMQIARCNGTEAQNWFP